MRWIKPAGAAAVSAAALEAVQGKRRLCAATWPPTSEGCARFLPFTHVTPTEEVP
ncbi:MAG: hypothetical protein KF683_07170 [Rubrivivax sp.]|nr:hypothetical protein [Rubrivivax sp.]